MRDVLEQSMKMNKIVFKHNKMKEIMKITEQAKTLLKSNGSLQWQQGYPNEQTFTADIEKDQLVGLYENGILVAFAALAIVATS